MNQTQQIETLQETLRITEEGRQAWKESLRVREETVSMLILNIQRLKFQRAIMNRLVILYLIMMAIHWLVIVILKIEKTCP